ncbi:MAG: redox-sensing transcriptional repressor Rex [Anaerolineales bacterium]|nr:redox-sensing transcriptional repressor Rex [Anaerolineales bacterium]
MSDNHIPAIVISRLPIYLRTLKRMKNKGQLFTSSQEMGQRLGLSAAQIRKDLSLFGEFGKQGTGYQVEFLVNRLEEILKVNRIWPVALIGAGDMGRALAHYNGFQDRGFEITAIFETDPDKIGQQLANLKVQDIKNLRYVVESHEIKVAMLAVPASVAQDVADLLFEAGVKAILNYAPMTLKVPEGIHVEYIDPSLHLQRMTYYL